MLAARAPLDRYEIIRTLSRGGMADLFLARQRTCLGVDRLVALKRLGLKYAGDPDLAAMFLDECRLALQLEHPHIVRTYGVEEWRGSICLALEYLRGVDGGSLIAHDHSDRGDRVESAIVIGHAIADGLAYIHSLGVVHRDIAPTSVFLCRDGSVKLLDVGAAAPSRAERRMLKGRYAYMSPEQCGDQPLDGRSDLFSLGILLYELTTGQRPFRATRSADVVRAIVGQTIRPPRAFAPGFPPDLEALLVRLLEKERERRPGSAAEVRDALVAVARRLGVSLDGSGLAARVAELAEHEAAAEPMSLREARKTDPSDPLVLVVDDEESFHAMTNKRLKSYRRIAAYTAIQALDALAAHPIDVVLLDLNLPDRSGLEVLEELRALGGDVAVIVCTAEADVSIAVECMRRGASDYLITSHESYVALGNRVLRALRRRGTPPVGVRTR